VPAETAAEVSHLPPVSVLFAAFLGYNPTHELIGPHVLGQLPHSDVVTLEGRSFFPHLIAGPFQTGLREAFAFAIVACLIAALASWSRGAQRAAVPGSSAVAPSAPEA
jgi:hypothetical protein